MPYRSIYVHQVNFSGLYMPCRSFSGVYLCPTGKFFVIPSGSRPKENVFAFPSFFLCFFRTFVFLFAFRFVSFRFFGLTGVSVRNCTLIPQFFWVDSESHSLPLNVGVWTAGFFPPFFSGTPFVVFSGPWHLDMVVRQTRFRVFLYTLLNMSTWFLDHF